MTNYSNFILLPILAVPAGCCLWASASAFQWRGRRARSSESVIWAGFGILFLAFIAIKAGGLLATVEDAARSTLRHDGMYNDRRTLQIAAICGASLAFAAGLWQMREIAARWHRYRLATIGSMLITCFAIIRAVSLHELDALGPWMVTLKITVEAAASFAAAWGALARVRNLASLGGAHA